MKNIPDNLAEKMNEIKGFLKLLRKLDSDD